MNVASMEPLMEPWKVTANVAMSPYEMDVQIGSKTTLNINVSHAVLQNVLGALSSEALRAASTEPFGIVNHTGQPIDCQLLTKRGFGHSSSYHTKGGDGCGETRIKTGDEHPLPLHALMSAATGETPVERVLMVTFTGGDTWKPLEISNINKTGVSTILLHAKKRMMKKKATGVSLGDGAAEPMPEGEDVLDDYDEEEEEEHIPVSQKYPRRSIDQSSAALVVAHAHAASRSAVVKIDNQSHCHLVQVDSRTRCMAGEWTYNAVPPYSIAPNQEVLIASESLGPLGMSGTEAEVQYEYRASEEINVDFDATDRDSAEATERFTLKWTVGFFGEPSCDAESGPSLSVDLRAPTTGALSHITCKILPRDQVGPLAVDSGMGLPLDQPLAAAGKAEEEEVDQESVICAVEVKPDGRKVIELCTKLQLQNNITEDVEIDFDVNGAGWGAGNTSTILAGSTTYARIECCSCKQARLRPIGGAAEFAWSTPFALSITTPEDIGACKDIHSCESAASFFCCSVKVGEVGPLDTRQILSIGSIMKLRNLLPRPIRFHLGMETDSANDPDSEFELEEGGVLPAPTIWNHRPAAIMMWLSLNSIGGLGDKKRSPSETCVLEPGGYTASVAISIAIC